MDPKLTEAINEQMPSLTMDEVSCKINQAGLYGTFGKPMELKFSDEQFVILGLPFSRLDMFKICGPTPLRRVMFIIEDKATGEVHVSESTRLSQGFALLKSGKIGAIFEKRFGEDFLNHIRVWFAHSGNDIEKYHVETYLLSRMVDKRRAEERTRVMLRSYERMTAEQRNTWRSKYPYAAEVVLKGHEDYHLRRA